MRLVRRILWIVVVLVVVLVAGVTGLVGAITLRSMPTTTGTIGIPGLDGPVDVVRDAAGIAHITADTPHDLFLAQGYVHAQERMWQMEVWRHISAGRLSELFGASTLDQDRFIRTLGWRQAAERDLAALPPEAVAAIEAYAAGVNAWLDDHRGGLGLPFVVTALRSGSGGIGGYDPEPWTTLDSVAWQKVQAWDLGGNLSTEIFRMLADAHLGDPGRTDELFPAYRSGMPVITPTGLEGSGGAGAAAAGASSPATLAGAAPAAGSTPIAVATAGQAAAWRDVAGLGTTVLRTAGLDLGGGLADDHGIGSNNWVVGPARSDSGAALLANDPHLGIGMPSVWFMNGLHCRTVGPDCPWDVAGVSFPGVPLVVLGHNARIAWGATNVDPDVQDLFVEELDPASDGHYLVDGASVPFEVRTEVIKVAGGPDVVLDVRETRHGPILNDVDERLADAPPMALRWAATAEVDGTLHAVYKFNTASTFEEFREAFRGYGAPAQNFVYADVDGHIGYVLPGRIPIRQDPADHGERPRSGSDGAHEWTGWIPFDDLPSQLDPPSGFIVSANNAAVDAAYPHFIGQEWDPGYRAQRIEQLLAAATADGTGVSVSEQREIQKDDRLGRVDRVLPHLVGVSTSTEDGALVAALILEWQGDSAVDSAACAAYLVFEYHLARALFDDELGGLAADYVGGSTSLEAMLALLDQPSSSWWDDTTTSGTAETADAIVSRALDAAGADLRATLGDPEGWTWGGLHTATFREQTLGSSGIGPLEWYFGKGPYAVPGAAGAVNNTYYRPSRAYPDPDEPGAPAAGLKTIFEVTNLPSYRLRIDLGALDDARIVHTTGQSGNPFDDHYGDLIDEWIAGDGLPLPFSPAAIDDAAVERLRLLPASG